VFEHLGHRSAHQPRTRPDLLAGTGFAVFDARRAEAENPSVHRCQLCGTRRCSGSGNGVPEFVITADAGLALGVKANSTIAG
jgi:hypothetical protein